MRSTKETESPVDVALRYAKDRKWRVLPLHVPDPDAPGGCSCGRPDCDSPGKHPRTRRGVKDATTVPDTIRRWGRQWPVANIGIATGGGLLVLDVDGEEGLASLAQLEKKHGALATLTARTGSGGRHLFFEAPEDVCRNRVRFAPGLDTRGDGGYVVAAPSRHVSGGAYEWLSGQTEPAPAPAWLVELLRQPSGNGKDGPAPALPEQIPAGQRNNTLASLAGSMRRRGASPAAILAALQAENAARCSPPLPDEEVERIAASVARYDPAADGKGADANAGPLDWSLTEVWADPEMLKPPKPVAPRFAWRSRLAVLVAREKDGKSTVAGAIAADLSCGRPVLGEPVERGTVLVVDPDEYIGDVARRFHLFEADPDRVFVANTSAWGKDPLDALRRSVEERRPDLVVVDTLATFVSFIGHLDSGDASAWTAVMNGLRAIAVDYDTAILVLHHLRKAGDEYRDSTAIGGGVDMILTLKVDADDQRRRTITTRGRWWVEPFAFRLDGRRLVLDADEVPLDQRLLRWVRQNPGQGKRAVRDAVGGDVHAVDAALKQLERAGLIHDAGNGSRHAYVDAAAETSREAPDDGLPAF